MSDPLVIVLGLGATLGFGIAPRPAAGMTADVGLHWSFDTAPLDGFSIALGARWDPPAAIDVSESEAGARMSTTRLLATVAPCAHWWKLFGCAVGELGQTQVSGEKVVVLNDRFVYAVLGSAPRR